MDTWVRITNAVTLGNIGTVVTLILGLIYSFYRIRRYLFDQDLKFKNYVAEQTRLQTIQVEQLLIQHTDHIEACIHQVPGHPESSINPQSADSKTQSGKEQHSE